MTEDEKPEPFDPLKIKAEDMSDEDWELAALIVAAYPENFIVNDEEDH